MSEWIKISERMPTKEERDDHKILWWHEYDCEPYPGSYMHYDGKWIRIGGRNWHQSLPLSDFTHWMIGPKEPKP